MDISVVTTAHNEGRLLHRTLRSIRRALAHAEADGVRGELIVVLDNPDTATVDYVAEHHELCSVIEKTAFGDPGLARNRGVELAAGRFVAIIDGDDLMGEEWLAAAHRQAVSSGEECVYYPEYVVVFDAQNLILRPKGTRHPQFSVADLIENNCWNSVHFFVPKALLERHPFCASPLSSGFGYEDWHWYCEIVAHGVDVTIVPETCVFYRKKNKLSRFSVHDTSNALVPPSALFDAECFTKLVSREDGTCGGVPADVATARLPVRQRLSRRFVHEVDRAYLRYGDAAKQLLASAGLLAHFQKRLEKMKRSASAPGRFPDWLLVEWRKMHEIEPMIFPERWLLDCIWQYEVPRSRIARSYVDLSARYGGGVSHLIVVPWLKTGGADLEVLHYVRALAEEGLAEGVVVLATNDTDSPWEGRLPAGVRFIEFGRLYRELSPDDQERLLTRVWLQMRPEVVHIINSDLAYRVLVRHGSALRTVSRVFANTFCRDYSAEGKTGGYPFWYFPDCIDYLTGVFCDNGTFLKDLIQLYALDGRKLHVHYQPMELPTSPLPMTTKKEGGILNVLWAGRLDRQKRPDILLAIADACKQLPVKFHVYGAVVLDADIYSAEMAKRENVAFHGPFDGFFSIPAVQYDLFLNTSQWDGLPNILMEAIAAGLPVISSDAGGIGELILDGKTGLTVTPYDSIAGYVRCLERACQDGGMLRELATNARMLVAERHSWQSFLISLHKAPEYFSSANRQDAEMEVV